MRRVSALVSRSFAFARDMVLFFALGPGLFCARFALLLARRVGWTGFSFSSLPVGQT